jgi:penicillin-binding protein 2
MFEKRLAWFWVLLTAIALVIVGRLVQIQVAQAAEFESLAERILTRRPDYIVAPRGTVFDRNGVPLLSDEPTSDICVHYALLADPSQPNATYLHRVARALRERGDYPAEMRLSEIVTVLKTVEIPEMWRRLAALSGWPQDLLLDKAAEIRARVERVKRVVQAHNPTIRTIQEETQLQPLLEDIDNDTALAVRLELERFPWLRVQPGSRRVAHDADALVHVLGRLGSASPERIMSDPLRGEELRELRAGDRCGISGVERLAETSLRGWRGKVMRSYDGTVFDRVEPLPGHNVHLTIDLDAQRHVLELLEQAVHGDPDDKQRNGLPKDRRAGAAAVVIDVESRELVALVSYPTYSYEYFNLDYERLRRDTVSLPLSFRAVQALYPPGSICKAISLVGALSDGVVRPETHIHCTGHLLPGKPNSFRCWIYNQYNITHDQYDDPAGQTGESAVKNSCNIYFYRVGAMLGPERLCDWFDEFGLGQTQGTGLIEENPGVVPHEAWLMDPARGNPRRHRTADAWNFAIGQGEVSITPLQAANEGATVASGFWAPVRLAYDDRGEALGEGAQPARHFTDRHMRVLRRGMWRVVNEHKGTATIARLDTPGYEICGKTGSAQTPPRVVNRRYICEWPDGRRETVVARSEYDALAQFGDEKPEVVGWRTNQTHPALEEGEKLPSHAWFVGYTQPKDTPPGGVPTGRVYSIAVIIEFGGSGGRVAAPVAKQIAEYLLRDGS